MWWTIAKEAVANWSSHKDARQGAALAYYSVFSLGPIILIAVAVAGLFFGQDAVTGQVMSSLKEIWEKLVRRQLRRCSLGQAVPPRARSQPFLG
jgi:uncharacterized BrkB/YihY/UPF0761 family membrane protein